MPEPSGGLDAVHEMIAADAMDRLADELVRVALSEDAVVTFPFMCQYHGLPAAQRAQQAARDDGEVRRYGSMDPATVHRSLELVTLLEELPVPQRERLAVALFGAHERDRVHRLHYSTLDLLGLACGLPDSDALAATRQRLLESMSGQTYAHQFWYMEMAEIEVDAGGTLPPAVTAVIRRSAHLHPSGARLAARLPDLALNVGEAWTDRALADVTELPPPWRELLAHAATAAASKPTAAWEKAGRRLLLGRAVREFGDAGTAELVVQGNRTALTWRNGAGKVSKSVPAAIRQEHQEELKDLKATVGDIDKMLPALVQRLDRQFAARRSWTYAAWRDRYLDQPLTGTIARRLLWTVDGEACGFADGELSTLAGAPAAGGTTVELWHPIGREPAEVLAWRDWLERHRITQPFKQAHREVYLLTDAERNTGTYSNRFAGHVMRQHQFHSLAAVRGWRNKLRIMADATFPPATRDLPQWGLRAEFWITGYGDDAYPDIMASGSYLRLGTDQVRFYPAGAPENVAHDVSRRGSGYYMLAGRDQEPVQPVPLTEIPALVLSEVMRDVDLFVGVASIGNDPAWEDGGPNGRFAPYWTSYSFGELDQTAQTRRDLLARLLPRLAIAGQCTIEGRFLHVNGTRHSYKIHLGSGNVMITPGDRYLCIILRRDVGPDLGYLPYEGDLTLPVIVSKAMLLARDDKITDPAILSQL